MSLVLDASAALTLVLPGEEEPPAAWAAMLARESIEVPDLWHYEVASALTVGVRRGRLTAAEAGLAAKLLGSLGVKAHPAPPSAPLLQLGVQYELSAYDAAYLALAIDTGGALATLDAGLRRAAGAAGVGLVEAAEG